MSPQSFISSLMRNPKPHQPKLRHTSMQELHLLMQRLPAGHHGKIPQPVASGTGAAFSPTRGPGPALALWTPQPREDNPTREGKPAPEAQGFHLAGLVEQQSRQLWARLAPLGWRGEGGGIVTYSRHCLGGIRVP